MKRYLLTLTFLLTGWALATLPKTEPLEGVSSLSNVISPYLEIQRALSQDKLTLIPSLLQNMDDQLKKLSSQPLNQQYQTLVKNLSTEIESFKKNTDPKLHRIKFGNISKLMIEYLKLHPKETKTLQLFFCPMFPQGYAFWVQRQGETLANPYWGHEMLECGVKRPWK